MMINNDNDLIEYYQNLLIIQYKNKPKARAHIASDVKPIIIFELANAVKNGYGINDSVGKQLDILGKYIGLERNLSDGVTVSTYGDSDFRNFLKFKIIKNFSIHSLKDIDTMLYNFFGTKIKTDDNEDMTGTYIVYNDLTLAKVLKYNQLFPRPMGVEIFVIATGIHPFECDGSGIDGMGLGFGKVYDNIALSFSDGSVFSFSDGSEFQMIDDSLGTGSSGGQLSAIFNRS